MQSAWDVKWQDKWETNYHLVNPNIMCDDNGAATLTCLPEGLFTALLQWCWMNSSHSYCELTEVCAISAPPPMENSFLHVTGWWPISKTLSAMPPHLLKSHLSEPWIHSGHRGLCHLLSRGHPLDKTTSKAIAKELIVVFSWVETSSPKGTARCPLLTGTVSGVLSR